MRRPGGAPDRDGPRAASRWQQWRLDRYFPLFIAGVAYGPLLLTHRGMVGADTKQYLYLDPGRMLSQARTMWDPNTGMGTVTHQNIGYLWPMGPWYRLFAAAGVPVWIVQRLWTGTLLLAAALGVRWLLRTLGWEGPGVAVASLAYMLSPYVVQYEARISAILMPWAALPWLLALAIRALRRGGWRESALFALLAATVGSVNATGLIYAGLAPVMWFPYAVWGLGVATARRAAVAMAKIGALTIVLSLWWIAGIMVEGRYGLNILRYTETVEVVARTGVPFEALRGLGNWFFYGRDAVGPWVQPAQDYTNWAWLLTISFTVPAMAFAAAFVVRWRYKLYFAGLILVGVTLAVGVHPYAHPSPLGSLFKAFATSSTLGLALRSTGRAVPLVALGSAVMLGAGIDAVWRRRDAVDAEEPLRRGWAGLTPLAFGLVTVLLLAEMAPLWLGQFVDNNLQRPETLPSYWPAAAGFLAGQGRSSAGGYDTRVLELPGADFSHYRWGATLDPVTPGLTDRPFVGRQLQPSGSPASADLLRALDRQLQEGVLDPAAIAPVARLMGVGDVLLRSDLQYERFHTPRPSATWQQFNPAPAGLQPAGAFGPPVVDHPVIPFTDEVTLANLGSPPPPAVAVFGVQNPTSIIRTEPATAPMVLAGDGEGVVDAATAGLLSSTGGAAGGAAGGAGGAGQAVLYAASLDPSAMATALGSGADLVLTDTNRRRAQRWGTVRDVNGYTEQAGEQPMVTDTNDARLPLFPGAGDDAYTVTQQRGGASVQATHYGNTVSYSPADRPDQAMDGNLDTSWKVGATAEAIGERLGVTTKSPITTGEVTLVQPLTPVMTQPPGSPPGASYQLPTKQTRVITQVTLTFDGGRPVTTTLAAASLLPDGQKVVFPVRTFHRLEIRIDDTSTHRGDHRHDNGVGFAEIRIGPQAQAPTINEVVRLPTDLLNSAANSANQHRMFVVLTRARANPAEPFKPDEEPTLARTFTLTALRSFALGGTARVSALASDQQVDRLLGRPDPPLTNSSGRLPGDLAARSSSALDGDPTTWWSPGRGPQEGNWISTDLPYPVSLDHWTMQVVTDGLHSVPTRLRVQIDNQPERLISLPRLIDAPRPGATASVPIDLGGPVTAQSRVTVTIDGVRPIDTLDSLSGLPITLPVGIAEMGLPGLRTPAPATTVPAGCRTDLLSIDGKPVGLRIGGTTAAAAQRTGLKVGTCGPGLDATGGITLGPGAHEIRTPPGQVTGIDLDQLIFGSDHGGRPLTVASSTAAVGGAGAAAASGAPVMTLLTQGRTSARVRIDPSPTAAPFWLVLGQSLNAGWQARLAGPGGRSLGPPRLIDGYANGWLVHPPPGRSFDVTLEWTPQRPVNVAIWVSLLGALLCVGLAAAPTHLRGFRATSTLRSARLPERPTAHRPWLIYEPQLSPRRTLGLILGGAMVASLLIGWLPGLVVAAFLALACRQGRWHALLGAAAVAGVVASGVYVTGAQVAHHYKLVLEWPEHFEAVSGVAWVAVALLVAEAAIGHVRGRRVRRSSTNRQEDAPPAPARQ